MSEKIIIIERRSRREWRSFGFTCGCVRMQWVPHYWHITLTHNSILWYIPWQDWTRFNTYWFNFSICSTPADCCTLFKAQIKLENPRRPNERSLLLGPKPQKQCINPSFWVTGRKYQKLYRYSKRIFSRKGAISTLRTVLSTNSDSQFLGGCRWFETAVNSNSITGPRRCSMVTLERAFKPSIVFHRPFTRRNRYKSVQL